VGALAADSRVTRLLWYNVAGSFVQAKISLKPNSAHDHSMGIIALKYTSKALNVLSSNVGWGGIAEIGLNERGSVTAEGAREMREAIAIIAATGEAIQRQYLLCVLARACGESGEASEGLNLLERALEIARSGAKYQFPELLRAKGDLLLRLNPHDDAAENWLRRALMAARDEGTKSLELRAALSLARLYRAHHREREARDVLAPIYAWFTEGFATGDLVQAKDLLDQLN
jgi:tetratricopeptide (TPR) repeat protein